MKDYNGFTAAQRQATYDKQKAMGLIAEMKNHCCSVCGGSGGDMMGHTEDYRNVYDLHPICVECHMRLHARFSNPGQWINHLIRIAEGWQPTQWRSPAQYFFHNRKSSTFKTLADIDPLTIGDQWFHQLKMQKISLV